MDFCLPAERMKAGVEHVVPLCDAAVSLLERLQPEKPNELIFAVGGAARSNMAMAMLLRRMKVDVTTHGFRSTFRDWAGDATDFPRELIEQALAYTIENKAERAYWRGTAVARRRTLVDAWALYLAGESKKAKASKPDVEAIIAALTAGKPLTVEQAKRVAVALGANWGDPERFTKTLKRVCLIVRLTME
jgi:hypothetical protein